MFLLIITSSAIADHLLLTCENKTDKCDVYDGTPNIDVRDDTELATCVRLETDTNDTKILGIQSSVVQELVNYSEIIAVGLNFTTVFEEGGSDQTWPGLKVVCMSSNRVEKLQQNSFLQAQNVSLIDLSENQIANIDPDTFAGLDDLEWLYLGQNLIEKFDFLEVLTGLKVLDLSNNLITNVSELTFMANQKLEVLKLQGNNISTIDLKAFQPLKQITFIDLSSNPLAMLDANAFCGLQKLTHLNLANTGLPENQAKNLSQLEMVKLTISCHTMGMTTTFTIAASPPIDRVSKLPKKKLQSVPWYESNLMPFLFLLVFVGAILFIFHKVWNNELAIHPKTTNTTD
jgi:Leucine-rich repeat (LRR) protein